MKTFIAAFALIAALPAAASAQSAPAQDHSQHKGMDHGEEKDCCEHKTPDGKPMDCCAKAMKDGKKMACCEKHEGDGAKADAHAGHKVNH
jgi:hypothetical protein